MILKWFHFEALVWNIRNDIFSNCILWRSSCRAFSAHGILLLWRVIVIKEDAALKYFYNMLEIGSFLSSMSNVCQDVNDLNHLSRCQGIFASRDIERLHVVCEQGLEQYAYFWVILLAVEILKGVEEQSPYLLILLLNQAGDAKSLKILCKVILKQILERVLSKGFIIDNSLIFEFKVALKGFSFIEIRELILHHQLLNVEEDLWESLLAFWLLLNLIRMLKATVHYRYDVFPFIVQIVSSLLYKMLNSCNKF